MAETVKQSKVRRQVQAIIDGLAIYLPGHEGDFGFALGLLSGAHAAINELVPPDRDRVKGVREIAFDEYAKLRKEMLEKLFPDVYRERGSSTNGGTE